MKTLMDLPENIRKEIEQIATSIELKEQTAQTKTSYRKDNEGGGAYKPVSQKERPSYTIAHYTKGEWRNAVRRYKKIDEFRGIIMEIINTFEPDFIRVWTYENDSQIPRKAGESIYTIVMNEGAGQPPPFQEELKIIPTEKYQEHTENFSFLEFQRAVGELFNRYEGKMDELHNTRLELGKTELNFQNQIQALKAQNEFNMLKVETNNRINELTQRCERILDKYNLTKQRLSECSQAGKRLLREFQSRLGKYRKEIQRLKEEINGLRQDLREAEQLAEGRRLSLQNTDKIITATAKIGGGILGQMMKPGSKIKRFLDGLSDMPLDDTEEEDIIKGKVPEKVGGAVSDDQPKTNVQKYHAALCDWIRSIENESDLRRLAVLVNNLSQGQISLEQIESLYQKPEGNGTN